jgi:spore coat protein H
MPRQRLSARLLPCALLGLGLLGCRGGEAGGGGEGHGGAGGSGGSPGDGGTGAVEADAAPDASGGGQTGGVYPDGSGGREQDAGRPAPDTGSVPPTPAHPVFDTSVLHRVEITVASQHLPQLDREGAVERVPCTVVVDGVTLPDSGIRVKGGNGSYRPLADKAAFSIKFNEFVKGQKLMGLSKLLLNNAVQDPSFLNEHLVYEIARRVGAPGPLTAHAAVTFNGQPYGFFVVREAINDDFLRRTFGRGNEDGNLYEGGEFVGNPYSPELKDEKEEMRSRADIRALSALIRSTPDPEWIAAVGAKLDIPAFLTGFALEALIGHWDGYFFGPHNYYVYDLPATGRFVFLVAGADKTFGGTQQPEAGNRTLLARKLVQLDETRTQLEARLREIVAGLDLAALNTRIDEVTRILRSHGGSEQRFRDERALHEQNVPTKKKALERVKAWRRKPPPDAGPPDR